MRPRIVRRVTAAALAVALVALVGCTAPGRTPAPAVQAAEQLASEWGIPGVEFGTSTELMPPGGYVDRGRPGRIVLVWPGVLLQVPGLLRQTVAHELAHVVMLRARRDGQAGIVDAALAAFGDAPYRGATRPPVRELLADGMAACLTGERLLPDGGYLAAAPTTAQRRAAGAVWSAEGVSSACGAIG